MDITEFISTWMFLGHCYGIKCLRFDIVFQNIKFFHQVPACISYYIIHYDPCDIHPILNANSSHLVGPCSTNRE